MKSLIIIILIIFINSVMAQKELKEIELKGQDLNDKALITPLKLSSIDHRKNNTLSLMGSLSILDTWVPVKYGAAVVYNHSPEYTFELDYLRGSLSFDIVIEDLGKLTDQRLSFLARSYSNRNSFHYIYGLYYGSFTLKFGQTYLDSLAGAIDANLVDILDVKVLGITWGMGSRWHVNQRITFGVDWFMINIPAIDLKKEAGFIDYTSDNNFKKDTQDTLDILSRIPTFTFLKVQLGVSF